MLKVMKMKLFEVVFSVVVFCITCASAYGDTGTGLPVLNVGVARDSTGMYSETDDRLAALMDSLSPKYGGNVSYTNFGSGNVYYALYEDMQIRAFNLPQKMYLGGWPLKRTADDSQPNIEQLSAANETKPDPDEYDFTMGTDNPPILGCLWNYPLRYGDVTGDGNNELVLFPGRGDNVGGNDNKLDLAIFSPQSHSVVFSIRLAREATGQQLADFDPNYQKKANYGVLPQILDGYAYSEGDAAMRYYAKLYFGDFDGNGKPDIIAWRKRYDSRTISDPVQGYKLTAQLLTHYELDNGVYKAQPTDEATIKGWLAAKNLTWQKGYPSTSECASDAGKPIPEMVDPTLNDPDVLQ